MKRIIENVTRVGTLAFRAMWFWEKKWTEGEKKSRGTEGAGRNLVLFQSLTLFLSRQVEVSLYPFSLPFTFLPLHSQEFHVMSIYLFTSGCYKSQHSNLRVPNFLFSLIFVLLQFMLLGK